MHSVWQNLITKPTTFLVVRGMISSAVLAVLFLPCNLMAQDAEAVQPDAAQPEAVQPEAVQPEAVQPEATQPEATQPPMQEEPSLFPKPKFRKLIEGIERTINPERDFLELSSRHDYTEVVRIDPTFNWAKDKVFRHDIWAYEFIFKPVRYIDIDLPSPTGKVRRKKIWYMVYRVKNPGVVYRLKPTVYEDKPNYTAKDIALLGDRHVDPTRKDTVDGELEKITEEEYIAGLVEHYAKEKGIGPDQVNLESEELKLRVPRFIPTFLLYSIDTGGKTYLDRILPAAQGHIAARETPNRKLLNSVQIAGRIPVSGPNEDNSVWGVVTWEDVDPRTDYFSIYIQGLTNAYKWVDTPTGRWFAQKSLRLDFWRPGDDTGEKEAEIRFLKSSWYYLDSNWASKPPR